MKRLLLPILLLVAYSLQAQVDLDSTTLPIDGSGTTFKAMRHLPASYSSGNTFYPLIMFFHGGGQSAQYLISLYGSPDGGYAYQQAQGKIKPTIHSKKDGKDYEFIYLSPQAWPGGTQQSTTAQELDFMLTYIYSHYRVDTSRVYLTGLSDGGQTAAEYVGKTMSTGTTGYKHHDIAAMAIMSENGSGAMVQAQADTAVADSVGIWAFGSTDTQGANTLNFRFYGDAFAGRRYVDTTTYIGGHCCWVQFYDSSYRKKVISGDTVSLQEWFLQKTTQHPFVQPGTRPPFIVGPAEYACTILNTVTNKGNMVNGDTTSAPNMPTCVHNVAAGPHNAGMIDCNGDLYLQGDNTSGALCQGDTAIHTGFVKVGNDSLGNPIAHIKEIVFGGTPFGNNWFVVALDSSGHIHIGGNTQGGISGDGTWGARASTKMITIPGTQYYTSIKASSFLDAIDSTGTEYRWGGGNGSSAQYVLAQGTATPVVNVPTAVTFTGSTARVTQISVGGLWTWSKLADGKIYSSSYYGQLTSTGSGGWANGPTAVNTEVRVDTALGYLPSTVRKIVANSAGTYLLLNNGTLWYAGDIACGAGGNGIELDFSQYTTNPSPYGGTTPHPYEWSQNLGELFQRKFTQIAPGKTDFIDVFSSPGLCYSFWAEDTTGALYSGGRGKGGILGDLVNEVGSAINAQYPNSYDRPYITPVNPYQGTTIPVTSPFCILNPSGVPCNSYSIPSNTKPVPHLTLSVLAGNRIKLDGSTSTDNVAINYYIHTQVSGSAVNMLVQARPTDTTSAPAAAGLQTFKLVTIDNGWLSDSVTASILVGPTSNAGTDQTISLPATSTMLSGSGSTTGGFTVTGYLWTKKSGPGTTTIMGNTTQTPTVSNLQAGVYVFTLQVTDSAGFTATDDVQVTVNASADCHCIILKY